MEIKKEKVDIPKIVALYLPQFYQTEYNDRWWEDGYTDWVACKRAKPLFKGHNQPRIPMGSNYYDLSVKENIMWQMQLAKRYGIDGFAIYQYYSCGEKLLEVPTEIIRDNVDLDLPFFLFWANESWRKNWFGQSKSVIWEQCYGDINDWREQFEYCLPYFKDERYMRIENKPIYAVYQPWAFEKIDEFIKCWNEWAVEEGLNGIYFLKCLNARDKKGLGSFDAGVTREPNYSFAYDEKIYEKIIRIIRMRMLDWVNRKILIPNGKGIIMLKVSYDKVWNRILKRKRNEKNVILGAFCDWDNSPRKHYNSIIMTGVTAQKFGKYMEKLIRKAQQINSPMIVINAWNEWGEGAYLEPDEKNNETFLKAIRNAKKQIED